MPIGDPFTTSVPSVGASGPAYATDVNALLTEIIDRLDTPVPVGSIAAAQAGESLDMNDRPILNVKHLGLYTQSAAPTGSPTGLLYRYAGDLYYYDTSGAVRITDGSGLNIASGGGIGGDYGGANPALVSFVDSTETYEFYDNEPSTQWAKLKARGLDLVDEATGRSTRIATSSSISATYDLTLPPAVSPGNSLLALSSGGLMRLAESATIDQQITFAQGADPKHGDLLVLGCRLDNYGLVSGSVAYSAANDAITTGTDASATVDIWLPPLLVGRRIRDVHVYAYVGANYDMTVQLYYQSDDGFLGFTKTPVGSVAANGATGGNEVITQSFTSELGANVSNGRKYLVRVTCTYNSGIGVYCIIRGVEVTWDYA